MFINLYIFVNISTLTSSDSADLADFASESDEQNSIFSVVLRTVSGGDREVRKGNLRGLGAPCVRKKAMYRILIYNREKGVVK